MKLAICSTNRWKYSETFIHAHYELLKKGDLLLSDGYLPTSFSADAGKNFREVKRSFWPDAFRLPRPSSKLNVTDQKDNILKLFQKHRIDTVLAEYGPSGVEMLPVCQALNLQLIVHFHGYDAYRQDVLGTYGKSYPELFQYASKVIAVSQHMAGQLAKLGCSPEKIALLRYGIDTERFAPGTEEKKELQIVSCGRFVPKKAPHLVLRAFAAVHSKQPKAQLVMIGEGELLDATKALAKELGIPNAVSFPGALTPDEVAKVLRSSSMFLQHSMETENGDSEGTPLSVLEAMATKLAVVATRHAGIPEVITHGEHGLLVEPGDWQDMAEKILSLVEDRCLRTQLGSAARSLVIRDHQKDQTLLAFERILKEKEA